jgi:hypothetical protein
MKLVLKTRGKTTDAVDVDSVDAARKHLNELDTDKWVKALLDDGEGTTFLWGYYQRAIDGTRWYEFKVKSPSIQNRCPCCHGPLDHRL